MRAKSAILGGAGLRTPLLLPAFFSRQSHLGLREVALMDIDAERLELIAALAGPKEYKRLRIFVAVEGSKDLALRALTLHPLVPDPETARAILEEYPKRHGGVFPGLQRTQEQS